MPRPLGGVVRGKSVSEAVHFDFLHVGAGGLLSTKSVGKQYIITW